MSAKTSGIARFHGSWGEWSQSPPSTKIMYFQKIMSIVKFLLAWHNNLQYVECRESNFVITVFILLPLNSAPQGGYTTCLPPLPLQILTCKSRSSAVCYLLKPSVTLSVLDSVIFLSTLFLEHPKLVFSIMTGTEFHTHTKL